MMQFPLEMMIALLLGAFLGFISAIPVAGPVSAVILSRGMAGKFAQGRMTAFGSAFVEGLYCFLSFWGFNTFLVNLKSILTISNAVASVLLFGLGFYFFRSRKMREPIIVSGPPTGSSRALFLGAGLSAINPSLIATWAITITAMYSMKIFEFSLTNSLIFSIGVCAGTFSWFFILLKTIERHRKHFTGPLLDNSLKAVGIILMGLSCWTMYRLISEILI